MGSFKGKETTLEVGAALIALGMALATLYNFAIGKHFVIPTVTFVVGFFFFNLAWFGLRGERWAKYFLLGIGLTLCLHTFFALFFAVTPKKILADAFYPVYGAACLLFAYLSVSYRAANGLYGAGKPAGSSEVQEGDA